MERRITVLPPKTVSSPDVHQHLLQKHFSSHGSSLVSWVSYFCTDEDFSNSTVHLSRVGLVRCPICSHHLPNHCFVQHLVAHLFINEQYTGTLWPFEFCHECLFYYNESPQRVHRDVHSCLRDIGSSNSSTRFIPFCPICEQKYESLIKFAVHLYEYHVFRDAPYVCPICYTFRASRHISLMKHLRMEHAFTDALFCPYCLKRFDLKELPGSTRVFDARDFYQHLRAHWDDITYRCESCRLEFLHRRELHLHEYLHHCVYRSLPIDSFADTTVDDVLTSTKHLSLFYSDQLRAAAPRIGLKCLECGELLRHPISRHFNVTVVCPVCRYSSSCSINVHLHWCCVHQAPPVSLSSDSSVVNLSSHLTSWERCIGSLVRYYKAGVTSFSQESHDACGSLSTRIRRCKEKHTPPGIEFMGILRCRCGFRTILGNQMARHLAVGVCGNHLAYLDKSPRLLLFSIVRSSRTVRRLRYRRRIQLSKSPVTLQSVGLCSNT